MLRLIVVSLALLFSSSAALISVWIVIPAPLVILWIVAVGASEWSLWFGLLGLIGVILALWGLALGSRWPAWLALGLAVLTMVFAAVPPLQSLPVARANNVRLSLAQYIFGLPIQQTAQRQTVPFAAVDGQSLVLDVYTPSQPAATTRPAIIVIHGGSWSGGQKSDFPRWNQWLVDHGFVVFDIEYRLAPQPNWQTATADVKCAIGWVKQNAATYNVDAQRLALWGRSAGGHLALLAAYTPDEPALPPSCPISDTQVQAVVAFYGPADLLWGYTHPAKPDVIDGPGTLRRFLGGDPQAVPDAFRIGSPITHVGSATPPTLLLHGRRDNLVGARHSELLAEQLSVTNIPHQTVYIPYGQHGFDYNFNGWGSQIVQPVTLKFLQTYLE